MSKDNPKPALGGANQTINIGTVIADRYEVEGVLGQGNMGSVYKARHKEIGREIAIKVLHDKLSNNPTQLQRFKLEAKTAGSLSHPNVCAVYDFGELPDGRPYLVMDYLTGISLADLIHKEGHIEQRRAVKLLLQVCDGLKHAHNKGLVHRDLKASNVMISNADGKEVACIVDFGIAKNVKPDEGQHLTQTGEVFGSPLYMSPEQCQGFPLDQRSDIYSFGCMIYETLSGKPPLKGENVVQTIVKHIKEDPLPLSEIRPDLKIDERLQTLVAKAMRKNVVERYQTVADLQSDLEIINSGLNDASQRTTLQMLAETEQQNKTPCGQSATGNFRLKQIALPGVVALAVAAVAITLIIPKPSTSGAVAGNGDIKEFTMLARDFNKITVDLPSDVRVDAGQPFQIKVECDANLRPFLHADTEKGTLRLFSTRPLMPSADIKFVISTPTLEAATVNGTASFDCDHLKGKTFRGTVNGAGQLSSSGTADHVDISVNGAGKIDLSALQSKDASVTISGAADAQVAASENLSVTINGSGNVKYAGNPQLKQTINGAGNITHI